MYLARVRLSFWINFVTGMDSLIDVRFFYKKQRNEPPWLESSLHLQF